MKWFTGALIVGFLLCSAVLSSCGGPGTNSKPSSTAAVNASAENSNASKTNVEELSLLINVLFEPEDIVWKEDKAHKALIAVLRFSADDANKLVADAAVRRAPQPVTLNSSSWFPAELIAQSDMSGDESLHGMAYAADAFYQDPFTSGRLVRIDGTDYFVLELSSK